MQQFIYYCKQLYMFQASICPSSGVLGCILIILLHMVSSTSILDLQQTASLFLGIADKYHLILHSRVFISLTITNQNHTCSDRHLFIIH